MSVDLLYLQYKIRTQNTEVVKKRTFMQGKWNYNLTEKQKLFSQSQRRKKMSSIWVLKEAFQKINQFNFHKC